MMPPSKINGQQLKLDLLETIVKAAGEAPAQREMSTILSSLAHLLIRLTYMSGMTKEHVLEVIGIQWDRQIAREHGEGELGGLGSKHTKN